MSARAGLMAEVERTVLFHVSTYVDVPLIRCGCGLPNLTPTEHSQHVVDEVERTVAAFLDPVLRLLEEWRAYGASHPGGSDFLSGYNSALLAQAGVLAAFLGELVP